MKTNIDNQHAQSEVLSGEPSLLPRFHTQFTWYFSTYECERNVRFLVKTAEVHRSFRPPHKQHTLVVTNGSRLTLQDSFACGGGGVEVGDVLQRGCQLPNLGVFCGAVPSLAGRRRRRKMWHFTAGEERREEGVGGQAGWTVISCMQFQI